LGTLVAAVIFGPCLAWNAAHGLHSMRFQFAHVFAGSTSSAVPAYLGGVIFGVGPIVLVAAALFLARTHTAPARRLLAVTAVPILITAAVSLVHRVHPNWPALVYPGLCAAAGAFAATLGDRATRIVVGASVGLGVVVAVGYGIELRQPRLFKPDATAVQRFNGWRDVVAQARQVMGEPVPYVIPSNYQVAAQLAYYGDLRRFGPTFNRVSQFTLWNDLPAAGERVVVVDRLATRPDVAEQLLGGRTAPPVKVESYLGGRYVRELWITVPETDRPGR
jgi:hypothetical protein